MIEASARQRGLSLVIRSSPPMKVLGNRQFARTLTAEAGEVRTPPHGIAAVLTPARPRRGYSARPVRRQVELILASADFDASRRSKEFLHFIVEETLAGRGQELSQSVIATRVFGR